MIMTLSFTVYAEPHQQGEICMFNLQLKVRQTGKPFRTFRDPPETKTLPI
jgi:hypothetical protein